MVVMTPEFARRLLRYHAQKLGSGLVQLQAQKRAIFNALFAQQRAFIMDPARIKAALCGRRAGKSTCIGHYLFLAALEAPGAFSCYIGVTRKNAKLLMWPELQRINRRFRLGGKVNNSDLTITMPNGHVIFLGGADNEKDIEKYRSFKYKLAVIDEIGSMPEYVKKLVQDVLEPACLDVDGTIAVIGTPGPVCEGYFYDLTNEGTEETVSTHHWTCLENPFVPNARRWLADKKKKHGWDDNHPTYLREWLGKWVPDTNSLVYLYNPERNGWDGQLPDLHGQSAWEYTLGVDYGYSPDATGLCLIAYASTCKTAFVVHAEKMLEATPTEVAERIDDLRKRFNIVRIVLDIGAKGVIEEWKVRFRLPVTAPYEKKEKKEHIALVNDALGNMNRDKPGTVRLKIKKDLSLVHELNTVLWDEKRKKPDPRNPNDQADAFEYAFFASYHFAAKEPQKPTSQLTPEERIRREEEQYERRAVKRIRRERRARDLGL